jgi:hypothetical protein
MYLRTAETKDRPWQNLVNDAGQAEPLARKDPIRTTKDNQVTGVGELIGKVVIADGTGQLKIKSHLNQGRESAITLDPLRREK